MMSPIRGMSPGIHGWPDVSSDMIRLSKNSCRLSVPASRIMPGCWRGPKAIGKASLAYALAAYVLSQSKEGSAFPVGPETVTARWIAAKSHPDLFVLERRIVDKKTARLKTEIAVDDAREMSAFFARTSGGGGWRVAIIDAGDDLNTESANALLKLVEEPPPRCLLLIVCHRPGRLLRTLKSRCLRLPMQALTEAETLDVLGSLPLEDLSGSSNLPDIAPLAHGSPGRALELVSSEGASIFTEFLKAGRLTPAKRLGIVNRLSPRGPSPSDFEIFSTLLLDWLAQRARDKSGEIQHSAEANALAAVYSDIVSEFRVVQGFNLDRRQAILNQILAIEDALKAA